MFVGVCKINAARERNSLNLLHCRKFFATMCCGTKCFEKKCKLWEIHVKCVINECPKTNTRLNKLGFFFVIVLSRYSLGWLLVLFYCSKHFLNRSLTGPSEKCNRWMRGKNYARLKTVSSLLIWKKAFKFCCDNIKLGRGFVFFLQWKKKKKKLRESFIWSDHFMTHCFRKEQWL